MRKEGRKEGQNGHVDLRARTSPQVKIVFQCPHFGNTNEVLNKTLVRSLSSSKDGDMI